MVLPNITLKFNLITVIAAVAIFFIGLGILALCFLNRNKIMENYENYAPFTSCPSYQPNYDPMTALKNNKGGVVPLPEGQLNFFYDTSFHPKCCNLPQQYSSSTGCACITPEQMRYLNTRGGNRNYGGDF